MNKQQNNFMAGGEPNRRIVLKGHSIRKVENCRQNQTIRLSNTWSIPPVYIMASQWKKPCKSALTASSGRIQIIQIVIYVGREWRYFRVCTLHNVSIDSKTHKDCPFLHIVLMSTWTTVALKISFYCVCVCAHASHGVRKRLGDDFKALALSFDHIGPGTELSHWVILSSRP